MALENKKGGRALAGPRLRALALVAPLLLFILVTFVAPLAEMFRRSVHDPLVADNLPETLAALRGWDQLSPPGDAAYAALARELVRMREAERALVGQVGRRLNRVESGMSTLVATTARELATAPDTSAREKLVGIDAKWATVDTWFAIQSAGQRFTARYYLNALDLDRRPGRGVVMQEENRRIYLLLLWRTLWVSLSITVLCLLLGYPVAHLISHARPERQNLLLALVLVPFWTSLLVRTTSWIVLLQNEGVVNDALVGLGLIADNGRLALVYNMIGTFVAMTHVLLPFMVLPLYSVMRSIPAVHMKAAASLGASPVRAFWRVYWPQTLSGVGAGALLVFILAIGFYITPALVGGASGELISNKIAQHMQTSPLNRELAAALGVILLAGVGVLYVVYDRLVGVDKMKLG